MNERIKELAEQALKTTMLTDAVYRPEGYANAVSKDFADKFAELIIKKCLKIVEPTEDSGDEWCVTLKGTAEEIKECFGVQ